jgi:cation diffusion facilitator CzcD-associated flavoprotein CzcO
MHTANWEHEVDFKDKTVGLIGTGSSSVQLLPHLQRVAKQVQVYMRSPTWISPPIGGAALAQDLEKGSEVDPGNRQYTFTETDKERFRNDPEYHLNFRQKIEAELNGLFGAFIQGSAINNEWRKQMTEEMHKRIGDGHPELKDFIFPTFSPGCRRLTPGDGYLEALVKPNVEPIFTPITKVTKKGLLTEDGKEHAMDILVCATGFNVAFKPAFKVINGEGKSIKEDWGDGVNLYFGVSAPR